METSDVKPNFVPPGGSLIDCDIHNELPSIETLFPYLPDYWCDYTNQSAFNGVTVNDYPKGMPMSARPDATPPKGGRPGSSLALLQRLFDNA